MLYIGTYAEGVFRVPFAEGKMGTPVLLAKIKNASYLCTSRHSGRLYAVSETGSFAGEYGGGVVAFCKKTGDLVSSSCTEAQDPCHLTENPAGDKVYAANYTDGAVSCHTMQSGAFCRTEVFSHRGRSVHPERQTKPYVHCTRFTPDGKFLCAVDLGTDRVKIYEEKNGLQEAGEIVLPAGAGPRHLTFSKDGRFAYLVTELSSEIFVYAYHDGCFAQLQKISILPRGIGYPDSSGAAVRATEHFVYASNRGHNSIAVLERNEQTGRLCLRGWISSEGEIPRDFCVAEELGEEYLLVANQESNCLVLLHVSLQDMKSEKIQSVEIKKPVCVLNLPSETE